MPTQATSYMPWFSVVNVLTIILAVCQILLGLVFILIILCNRIHRTVSNCLVANTVFSITLYAVSVLLISVHIRQCDNSSDECLKDAGCLFRDYLNNVASTAAFYSLTVESIHRLLAAVFIHNNHLQMYQIRLILCFTQWIISFFFPIYYIYYNPQVQYDPVSYVCVIIENSNTLLFLYMLFVGFLIPIISMISIYIKIFFFVRKLRKSTGVTGLPSALSSKHELRMAKHILLLLGIFALGSVPGIICQSIKSPPAYQYRIYYMGVITASFFCLLCLFHITPVIRQQFIRWKKTLVHTVIDYRNNRRVAPQENRY